MSVVLPPGLGAVLALGVADALFLLAAWQGLPDVAVADAGTLAARLRAEFGRWPHR